MPQMSPMKWLMIFFFSFLNLFIFMILMNSIYLNLNYKNIKKNYEMKWKWMW